MPENQIKAPELEQTSEQQSLASLIGELQLPDEVIGGIEKITQDKREELILFLQEIQEDLKNGKIKSPTDATDKARNILKEYNVTVVTEFNTENEKNKKEFKELSESLTKVKSLDPVVEDELKKAKEEKPNLPPELTKAVAEKTGVNIQSLGDIMTKGGEKQQDINNMIDAYYLANIDTTRITELLKGKKSEQEINESFATLRNSARHLDIPVYETARNISKLIPDLTDKTQKSVIETVNSLTKDNPDTRITRLGDTLRFTDPKNEKYSYEIDLGKQPPRLAKSLNGLSISRELDSASPEEQEKQNKKTQTEKLLRDTTEKRNSTLEKHWLSRREEYGLKGEKGDNLYSVLVGENRDASTQYEQLEADYAQGKIPPKDRADTVSRMLTLTESMKIAHKGRYTIDSDNNDREHIEDMLEGRIQNLRNLRIQEENLARIDKTPLEYKKGVNTDEVWGQEAEKSLTFLSELGFPILGQDTMEEFFEAWNLQNKNSVNYQVKLGEQPIIDDIVQKQLRGYMTGKFGEIGGKRNKDLTQLRENLRNDNFNQNNWNRIEKRQSYLFDTRDGETAAKNTSTQGEASPILA